MALQADRQILSDNIMYFVNSITGASTTRMERGGVVCQVAASAASGGSMDSSLNAVEYATDPSGKIPLGVLAIDFVNLDQSRQELNRCLSEAQIGTKAVLYTKGEVVTNMLEVNAATGTMPAIAYAGPTGTFTTINATGRPVVGLFLTRKDADGFARVRFNL